MTTITLGKRPRLGTAVAQLTWMRKEPWAWLCRTLYRMAQEERDMEE